MKLEALYALIRRFEGLRLKVYKCPAGVWTQGYGHTGKEITSKTPPITREEAEDLLHRDAILYASSALKLSPILATDSYKLAAIADFNYNLGSTRYKASTLKRCVDRGDWEGAQEQLKKWVWGGGKKLPGLVARREAEGKLLG